MSRGVVQGEPFHERLTALDSLFVDLEDGSNHMHIAVVMLFEAAGLRRADGSLDRDRLRDHVAASLDHLPRWRQRLARVPLLRDPVWIDDDRFELDRHLPGVTLPPPGDRAALEREVGRILALQLDRSRPLWELWTIDGLRGDRFAVVAKAHHCMVDGIAGMGVIGTLLQPSPQSDIPEPRPWRPRPPPGGARLLGADLRRRLRAPRELLREARQAAGRGTGGLLSSARDAAGGLKTLIESTAIPSSRTALNPKRVSPERTFTWTTLDLDEVKAIKRRHGTTVNDVVLAITAGAARRFLLHRGESVDGIRFRAMIPVSTHAGEVGMGNEVSLMLAPLPVGEASPERRLQEVARTMRELKSTGETSAVAVGEELADWTIMSVAGLLARAAILWRPYNVIVTNIPGPQAPLYLLESKMIEAAPVVPLYGNQAVGIALLSYDGALCWGLNADPACLPDLETLCHAIDASFLELRDTLPASSGASHRE